MAWQPDQETIKELVGYLKDALNPRDPNAQKHATTVCASSRIFIQAALELFKLQSTSFAILFPIVWAYANYITSLQMLMQAKSSPDMTSYLAYIFSSSSSLGMLNFTREDLILVRCSAALTLKNNLKFTYKILSESGQDHVKNSVLSCLEDPNSQIRNYAGNVITEIVQRGGVLGWPELLPELLCLAGNERGTTSVAAQEGAIDALLKVCDDNKKVLNKEYQGQRPLEVIIPRLIDLTSSSVGRVRALALSCLNCFIPQQSAAITMSIDALLVRIFQLSSDSCEDVRRNVCRSLVHLVDARPEKIAPHIEGVVEYIVLQQKHTEDPILALEAAEFWLCIGENEILCPTLAPYLSIIIPVLLESMIYDEEDVLRLGGETEDADLEDKIEDIRPHFAKTRADRMGNSVNSNMAGDHRSSTNHGSDVNFDALSEGEIEEEEDDDGDSAQVEDRWNLRKCSAAALDVLASTFHQPVFAITLPYLKNNLLHHDWPNREAAVLAIGAVADGCMEAVTPHLPDLIPYLISLLDDKQPVVRLITCWALGRYSGWASHLQTDDDKKRYFEPMMDGILKKMLDKNKRVQESAASAFASLEDKARKELTPYCLPILKQFVRCFDQYKDQNMFVLYDCIETLSEHVGPALAQPHLIEILMPAMIQRWSKTSDQAQELFPLLECLSYVATALGTAFAPFAAHIFTRCLAIIYWNIEQCLLAAQNEHVEKPSKDVLVTSLDLLSAIIQALDHKRSGELVSSAQPRFFDLLITCLEDASSDVRQSSYALLGDCAVNVFLNLQPFLPSILPILVRQLDIKYHLNRNLDANFSVINNACWSCGEIAMNENQAMAPHIEKIYQRLMMIIKNPKMPVSVNENAAIALGRLGVDYSQSLAPHLAEFAKTFLEILDRVDDTDEKAHAFLGLNRIIQKNPQAMESCLLHYFKSSTTFSNIHSDYYHDILGSSFQRVC